MLEYAIASAVSNGVEMSDTRRKSTEIKKKLCMYRQMVATALKENKIFKVVSTYDAPKIKSELKKRGFLEMKVIPWHSMYFQMPLQMLVDEARDGNEAEYALLSKLIGHKTPDFMWCTSFMCYDISHGIPLLNRIQFTGTNFSIKDDLNIYVDKINQNIGDPDQFINYPRTYVVESNEDVKRFHREFKFTTVVSLILHMYENKPTNKFFCKMVDSVQPYGLDFALRYVEHMIDTSTKQSIAQALKLPEEKSKFSKIQWRQIIIAHDDVVKNDKRLRVDGKEADDFIKRVQKAGKFLAQHYHRRRHEGHHCVFMLKPAWSGQGEGIILSDDHIRISELLKDANRKFVIQKYIERPLLVYKTKFDLRQYFLITIDRYCLRGWSHPICSVKLASKEFTLKKFAESIHITNTSVQMNYKERSSSELPEHHMWSLPQLCGYIDRLGHKNAYENIIYPEMKRVLKQFTLAAFDNVELRPGRYELFGCDWLITDDLQTYLIEINRAPSLEYYTPVSTHVCGTALADLIKVTVDFTRDKTADTGGFEVVQEISLLERGKRTFWKAGENVSENSDTVNDKENINLDQENQIELYKKNHEPVAKRTDNFKSRTKNVLGTSKAQNMI